LAKQEAIMSTCKSIALTTAVLAMSGAAAVAQPPLVTDDLPAQGSMEHTAMEPGCPMMQHGALGSMPPMMEEGMMGRGMMGQGMMGGRAMAPGMMGQGMMGLTDAELTAEQRRQLADLHAERARRQFMLMQDLRAPRQRLRELMSGEELDVRAIGNAYDEVAKLQKDVLVLELRAQEEAQNILRDATAQAP
jgi:Spy/CpxP family protein refolding chaperone